MEPTTDARATDAGEESFALALMMRSEAIQFFMRPDGTTAHARRVEARDLHIKQLILLRRLHGRHVTLTEMSMITGVAPEDIVMRLDQHVLTYFFGDIPHMPWRINHQLEAAVPLVFNMVRWGEGRKCITMPESMMTPNITPKVWTFSWTFIQCGICAEYNVITVTDENVWYVEKLTREAHATQVYKAVLVAIAQQVRSLKIEEKRRVVKINKAKRMNTRRKD